MPYVLQHAYSFDLMKSIDVICCSRNLNLNKMDSEQIYEVIKKLIGPINPVADSSIDGKRKENIETFFKVFDMMHSDLDEVAYQHKNSPYASAKNIGVFADNALTKLLRD